MRYALLVATPLVVIACQSAGSSPSSHAAPAGAGPSSAASGATGGADGGFSSARTGAVGGATTVTFTPTPLPIGLPDLTNTLRGQYDWLGVVPYPSGWVDIG